MKKTCAGLLLIFLGQCLLETNASLMDDLKQTFQDAKDRIYGSLQDKAKEIMKSENLSNVTVTDLVTYVPKKLWNSLGLDKLKTLGVDNIRNLLNSKRDHLPPRVVQSLEGIMAQNMSVGDIINKLKDQTLSPALMTQLKNVLTPPSQWTAMNISSIKSILGKYTPFELAKVTNTDAVSAMQTMINNCNGNFNTMDCPPSLGHLAKTWQRKNIGRAQDLSEQSFGQLNLNSLEAEYIKNIPANVVARRKSEITSLTYNVGSGANVDEIKAGREYVKKLLEADGVATSTDETQVKNAINNLGRLKNLVTLENLSPNLDITDSQMATTLKDNAKALSSAVGLGSKSVMMELKELLRDRQITRTDVTTNRELVALASPYRLLNAINSSQLSDTDIADMAMAMKKNPGIGVEGRRMALSKLLQNKASLSSYPEEVLKYVPKSSFLSLGSAEAKTLMSTRNLTSETTDLLMQKLSSYDVQSLNERALSYVPLAKIKEWSVSDLTNVASKIPPLTTLAMVAKEKKMGFVTTIDEKNIQSFASFLPLMGTTEGLKFNMTSTMEVFDVMNKNKMPEPAYPLCSVLREQLIGFGSSYMGAKTTQELMKTLTVHDVNTVPVCVTASFGSDLIAQLGNEQKCVLLTRLGKMNGKDIDLSITRGDRQAIIREGFKAMGHPASLQTGDYELLGSNIVDTPADYLSSVEESFIPVLLKTYQDAFFSRDCPPCLDPDQRSAIANMMKQSRGPTSSWDSINDISCLIDTLSDDDLDKMDHMVLTSSVCDLKPARPSVAAIQEANCRNYIGNSTFQSIVDRRQQLKNKQRDQAISMLSDPSKRKKRQSTTSANCEKASYGGAEKISTTDLQSMGGSEVLSCLSALGFTDMTLEKARILASKVKTGKNSDLKTLTPQEIAAMNWILKGFSVQDFDSFPTFKAPDYNLAVEAMGKNFMFSEQQVDTLITKITEEWKPLASMTAAEVTMLNNLICGLTAQEINSISSETFRSSGATLGKLKTCPVDPVLQTIATRCQGSDVYDAPSNWDAAVISDMNVILSGVAPEKIKDIPALAFKGLSPQTVPYLPDNVVKSLSVSQLQSISPSAAVSFTSDQKSSMTTEMTEALRFVVPIGAYKAGARVLSVVSPVLPVLLLLLTHLV